MYSGLPTTISGSGSGDKQPSQEQRDHLRGEFLRAMQESFMSGNDKVVGGLGNVLVVVQKSFEVMGCLGVVLVVVPKSFKAVGVLGAVRELFERKGQGSWGIGFDIRYNSF